MRSQARQTALSAVTLLALAACSATDLAAPSAQSDSSSIAAARGFTFTKTGNQAPTAWISSPEQGATFNQGAAITFTGVASDPETGALSGGSLVWRSSRDGLLGTGASLVKNNLTVGRHTITLTATDPLGATFSHNRDITIVASTPNSAPVPSITSPVNGTSVYTTTAVTFAGSATDAEDGTLADSLLSWSSSIDGAFGMGRSLTRSNLSVGTHTITLTAKDSRGAVTSTTRSLIVTAPVVTATNNQSPTGWISTPANAAAFAQGTAIQFTGGASDPEDGTLSGGSIVWSSSLNGQIGTGTSFSRSNLSVGTHTITMTSTDSKGASFTHNRTITITAGAPVNQAPTANFTANCLLLVCSFNASASTDDAGISQYSWNFGNGVVTTVAVPLVSNTYLIAGTVNVTLTVRDAAGLTNSVTKAVSMVTGTTTGGSTAPSGGSMEPSGMTRLAENDMSCLRCNGWYLAGNATVTSDPSAPNGSAVVQQDFEVGMTGGSAPGTIGTGLPQRQTIYMALWMKMSSNYVGHPTGVNKVIQFWTKNGRNTGVFAIRGSGSGPLKAGFSLQGLAGSFDFGGGNVSTGGDVDPNLADCSVTRGKWHKYEIVLVNNTPGVADGRIQYWLDGAKCRDVSGVMFVADSQNNRWEEVMWDPTWGGTGGTVTTPFYTQVNRIYVSGK